MGKTHVVVAVLFVGISMSLAVAGKPVLAQGPAGQGAAEAAQDSSHSFSPNPMKWVKKDSKNPSNSSGSRNDLEQKLTPGLQAQGLLPPNTSATDACAPFADLDGCLAALHASHNLALDFYCLRADVTGVDTSADISGCKVTGEEKAQALNKAIHQLKPEANAKQAAKDAEQQANDDLKKAGA